MNKIIKTTITISLIFILTLTFISCNKSQKDNKDNEVVITSEWEAMVQNNYNEFIAEVSANSNFIPFIVHTDQHGSITYDSDLYKTINKIVDWTKISKIINLGDTVSSSYNKDELSNYVHASSCLPLNKRIEQIGNHDRLGCDNLIEASGYFVTPNAKTSSILFNFVVEDTNYNVKYIAVDNKQSPWGYESGYLDSERADFIINELSKKDSYDIILLSHAYLFRDKVIDRNGETFTGADYFIGSSSKYTNVKASYVDMLSARKNKTSGVLIDCEGNSHPYDFSNCTSDFLMTIHGHHHTEGYETNEGITAFLFQSMVNNNHIEEPNCFYFCYIDKENLTFKCWKNVIGYSSWQINI